VPRYGYRVGVPAAGFWRELANSDAVEYGGSGVGNLGGCETSAQPAHGHPQSMEITLPPLGAVFFKPERVKTEVPKS
jgi:1,4-alpha-glucan branching enzyme